MNEVCGLMRSGLAKGASYPVMVMCMHVCAHVHMCERVICVRVIYSSLY